MSKPKAVKVGGHQYSVTYHDLIYDRDEQQEYMGRCSYPDLEMSLKEGRAPSQLAETFLHESVHAINADRRLDMSEQQVDQIAAGMLCLIVDNAAIFGEHFMEQWSDKDTGRDAQEKE